MTDDEALQRMKGWRRDFHMYPETGWAEFRTTAKIAEALQGFGCRLIFCGEFVKPEFVMGRSQKLDEELARAAMQGASQSMLARMQGCTGLMADIEGVRPGPLTALRFDIDCVDVQESDDTNRLPVKEGFLSRNPGQMHACGHDGHAAVGLALAEELINEKDKLCGRVRLIFQPAEEGVRGAYALTMSGAVDGAGNFLAMHLGLGHPTGSVIAGVTGFLCTTKFDACFTGVAAHAGAEPEKGRNALLAAAEAALMLSRLPSRFDGIVRVNVGVLNAGVGRNVVPPNANMKIETRGENRKLAESVYAEAVKALNSAADKYDVSVSISKQGESISADSDKTLAAVVAAAARSVSGVDDVEVSGKMAGSDDACWMMDRVMKNGGRASYVIIGADTAAGHHNGSFDFDEKALSVALGVLKNAVISLNGAR